MSWQVCIAMRFYEGSVGDRIAQLKGGKLPLPDILRFYIYLLEVYNLLSFFHLLIILAESGYWKRLLILLTKQP